MPLYRPDLRGTITVIGRGRYCAAARPVNDLELLNKRIMSFRDAVDAGKVGDRERVSLRWGWERRLGRVAKTHNSFSCSELPTRVALGVAP